MGAFPLMKQRVKQVIQAGLRRESKQETKQESGLLVKNIHAR